MAASMALKHCSTKPYHAFLFHLPGHPKPGNAAPVLQQQPMGRRRALAALLLVKEAISSSNAASAFDFRITTPDQTLEEADAMVKVHARELVKIKAYIDSQSWREAQIALRESSSLLKQDLYTIIQAKPGSQRPQLRKLYSILFNNVSMLDYAARDKNISRIKDCYDNIVSILNEIFELI